MPFTTGNKRTAYDMSCLELSAVLYVLNAAAVLIGQTRGIFNFIIRTNIFSSALTVSFLDTLFRCLSGTVCTMQ